MVLTGINLGSYTALCREGRAASRAFTSYIEKTTIERVRLSSLEPPDVNEALLESIAASHGRIAPFLHICLQSGCDETLHRMRRAYGAELIAVPLLRHVRIFRR